MGLKKGSLAAKRRMAKVRKARGKKKGKKRIDQRENWRNGRTRGKGGRFTKKMNPALETVLLVADLSRKAWNALPESRKREIHMAVKKGQIALARRLGKR